MKRTPGLGCSRLSSRSGGLGHTLTWQRHTCGECICPDSFLSPRHLQSSDLGAPLLEHDYLSSSPPGLHRCVVAHCSDRRPRKLPDPTVTILPMAAELVFFLAQAILWSY